MHPSSLSIKDFNYHLPEEKIAKFPLQERDHSRLLVYKQKNITEGRYSDLADHLPPGALLLFNNTKVVEARILFQKPTGAQVEIFTLEPDDRYKDITEAMKQKGTVFWKCLIGGASKWKHGQSLIKEVNQNGNAFTLNAKISDRFPGSFLIEFNWVPTDISFAEMLEVAGSIPIPPYLKRETAPSDKERYQTIFAKEKGSVAAPTAALHFTEKLLGCLKLKNIDSAFLTLHVGAGTFMPVKAMQMQDHEMHAEFIEVSAALMHTLKKRQASIFPVGTTSLRALESIYWMGVKCMRKPDITYEELGMKQWEVYDELASEEAGVTEALDALENWMQVNKMDKLVIRTKILIAPGYSFKLVSGLITNFHQPQSTLLLLVAALVGDDWTKIYEYALSHDFRFLSYGDGCLLFRR